MKTDIIPALIVVSAFLYTTSITADQRFSEQEQRASREIERRLFQTPNNKE
jgi:uncharacterized tellurite resistance protein B-like protein